MTCKWKVISINSSLDLNDLHLNHTSILNKMKREPFFLIISIMSMIKIVTSYIPINSLPLSHFGQGRQIKKVSLLMTSILNMTTITLFYSLTVFEFFYCLIIHSWFFYSHIISLPSLCFIVILLYLLLVYNFANLEILWGQSWRLPLQFKWYI